MSSQCSGGCVVKQTRVRESKDSFWFILVFAGQTVTAVHIDYSVSAYIEGETF